MKTICIFGADGRTGKLVVEEALKRGHRVQGFVYKNNHNFPKEVLILEGNVIEQNDVLQAVSGCDAIISVLGHIKGSDPLMQTKGIRNIVNAMQKSSITRIISLTGTGVRQPGDKPSLIDRILNLGIRLTDPERIKDGIEHAKILQNSNLDWTILRVLKLGNSNREPKNIHLTPGGPAELLTSRKKAAKILVSLTESNDFNHQMPVSS